MDEKIAHQILDELLSSFEALETQSAAILQFVKAKGIASEEELAPYFQQAGEASSVRWRAARVRINRLASAAIKSAEQSAGKESKPTAPGSHEEAGDTNRETARKKENDKKENDRKETDSKETDKKEIDKKENDKKETDSKDSARKVMGSQPPGRKDALGEPQGAQMGEGDSKPEAAPTMTDNQNKEGKENSNPDPDAGKRAA